MFWGVFFQLTKNLLPSLNGYDFAPLAQLIEREVIGPRIALRDRTQTDRHQHAGDGSGGN
jgi:hypothetical protein